MFNYRMVEAMSSLLVKLSLLSIILIIIWKRLNRILGELKEKQDPEFKSLPLKERLYIKACLFFGFPVEVSGVRKKLRKATDKVAFRLRIEKGFTRNRTAKKVTKSFKQIKNTYRAPG